MTDYIRELREKYAKNQYFFSFLIKEAIKNFFQQKPVRQ